MPLFFFHLRDGEILVRDEAEHHCSISRRRKRRLEEVPDICKFPEGEDTRTFGNSALPSTEPFAVFCI